MGHWEHTTYIRTSDCDAILFALDRLFQAEGMRKGRGPYRKRRRDHEPMATNDAMGNNLWGVAAMPGWDHDADGGWAILKTAPLSLLGERAPGAVAPRLHQLCVALQVPALQINVYDDEHAVILESDGRSWSVSGSMGDAAVEPGRFYAEEISEDRRTPALHLLTLDGILVGEHMGRLAKKLADRLGGGNARAADNVTSVHSLVMGQRIPAAMARDGYWAWPAGDRDEGEAGKVKGLDARFKMR